jgi:thiosulfate/3-mercaptopyruvate sulfurtransferase
MPASPLVSADWLKARLAEVVVLDASVDRSVDESGATIFKPGHALFDKAHIPGAQFADLFAAFSDPAGEFLFTRPTAEGLERAARAVGISSSSMAIVYDSLGGAWAARLWWVLRANGFDAVHVLDGGLAAWIAAGGPIEMGPASAVAAGDFIAAPRAGFFVDKDDVKALIGQDKMERPLVSGVRHAQYTGEGSDDPRSGHIPRSISLPYNELLGPDGLMDLEKLAEIRDRKGLKDGPAPVLYCGGGINAAGLALALSTIGQQDLTIYDGSLNEWKADPNLPLVRGGE